MHCFISDFSQHFSLKKVLTKKAPTIRWYSRGLYMCGLSVLKKFWQKKPLPLSSKGLIKSNCKIRTGNDNRSPQISTSNGARTVKSPRQRIQSYKNDLMISHSIQIEFWRPTACGHSTWYYTTPGNKIVQPENIRYWRYRNYRDYISPTATISYISQDQPFSWIRLPNIDIFCGLVSLISYIYI